MLIGVATGIVVGEIALFLPDSLPLLRLALVSFVAIIAAGFFGLPPVVPIQAGVSAILVLALGPETAGPVRMLDVGEALADAVRKNEGPAPAGLEAQVRRVAARCIELAGGEPAPPMPASGSRIPTFARRSTGISTMAGQPRPAGAGGERAGPLRLPRAPGGAARPRPGGVMRLAS